MMIGRTPSLSTSAPSTGADSDPPSIIADMPSEKLVRDQPNSPVIGSNSRPSAIMGRTVEPNSVPAMIATATLSLRGEKSDSPGAPSEPTTTSALGMVLVVIVGPPLQLDHVASRGSCRFRQAFGTESGTVRQPGSVRWQQCRNWTNGRAFT